jgi:hypothetical protein
VKALGVYVNVEQPDKQFLKNRGVWTDGLTWLYKQDDIGLPEQKEVGCDEANPIDSPTYTELVCSPFLQSSGRGKNKIEDCAPELIEELVNVGVMMSQGAVDTFSSNADGIFTHEKNFFWVDKSAPAELSCGQEPDSVFKRVFYPWDLDAAIGTSDRNVYGSPRKRRGSVDLRQTEMQRVMLGDTTSPGLYRGLYNEALFALSGPDFIKNAQQYLTDMQDVMTPLLEADPNSKIADAASHFDGLRGWLDARAANVAEQVCDDDLTLCGP